MKSEDFVCDHLNQITKATSTSPANLNWSDATISRTASSVSAFQSCYTSLLQKWNSFPIILRYGYSLVRFQHKMTWLGKCCGLHYDSWLKLENNHNHGYEKPLLTVGRKREVTFCWPIQPPWQPARDVLSQDAHIYILYIYKMQELFPAHIVLFESFLKR